jgi:MFS family permease
VSVSTKSDNRGLHRAERRRLVALGVPTLALALSVTTVSTYLPVVLQDTAGSTVVIGGIIGVEGLMALFVPVAAGSWSDRLRTRLGGRLPFLLAAAPVMAVTLALMPLASSLGVVAGVVALFFAAYFVAYEPYRALYADLFDDEVAGRAQSGQAVSRGLGTALALVGGGLLIAAGQPVPFAVGAVVVLLALGGFAVYADRRGTRGKQGKVESRSARQAAGRVLTLLRDHGALRAFLLANSLWEMSLAALKTFIVLYLTIGLGLGQLEATAAIGVAAPFILAGAATMGRVADRFGRLRVMRIGVIAFGIGLLVPGAIGTEWAGAASAPFLSFFGGAVMALPYGLLMPLMPEDEHGMLTGFYSISRGLGVMLGPLAAGVLIELLRGVLTATHGYQAMWLVCSASMLASLLFLRRLRRREADRRELRRA